VLAMGGELHDLRGPRIATSDAVHGTGCALSTAIAVGLAHGQPLLEAVRAGKQLVAERLADPVAVGRGRRSIS
jgi:hydroxymethylpyrimidine/phosphomethylpyrimidine kinase